MTDSHPHVLGMEVHTSTKMSNTIESTPETVLEVALKKFAELGFNDTRLEAIAKESGMSKRIISAIKRGCTSGVWCWPLSNYAPPLPRWN